MLHTPHQQGSPGWSFALAPPLLQQNGQVHRACSDADVDADVDAPVVVTAAFLADSELARLPEDDGGTVSVEKMVCSGAGLLVSGMVLVLNVVLIAGDAVGVMVVIVVLAGGVAVVVDADAVVVVPDAVVVETEDSVETDVSIEVARMGGSAACVAGEASVTVTIETEGTCNMSIDVSDR